MNTFYKIGAGILGLVIIFSIYFAGVNNREEVALGSVNLNGEYIATTTITTTTALRVLQDTPGVLGQVTITLAGTGSIELYDATTSGAFAYRDVRGDAASSTLASFSASATAGTYTFDARFVRGLVVYYGAFAGKSTITYR